MDIRQIQCVDFELKYVNRTVIKAIYCMFYVRKSCPAALSALLFT